MTQCSAKTKEGNRCSRVAKESGKCTQHENSKSVKRVKDPNSPKRSEAPTSVKKNFHSKGKSGQKTSPRNTLKSFMFICDPSNGEMESNGMENFYNCIVVADTKKEAVINFLTFEASRSTARQYFCNLVTTENYIPYKNEEQNKKNIKKWKAALDKIDEDQRDDLKGPEIDAFFNKRNDEIADFLITYVEARSGKLDIINIQQYTVKGVYDAN